MTARRSVAIVHGCAWGLLAAVGIALGVLGEGDRWIGPVVAAVCVAFILLIWARGSLVMTDAGMRGCIPWATRTPWSNLAAIEGEPDSGHVVAVRCDGTRVVVLLVPSFFWEGRAPMLEANEALVSRAIGDARLFGWNPTEENRH